MNEENEFIVRQMQHTIAKLDDATDGELHAYMSDLKKALLENEVAASLLLDEDIGMMARAIKRMNADHIAEKLSTKKKKGSSPKKRGSTTKKMTEEEMLGALGEL